jgi:hypothetical protein
MKLVSEPTLALFRASWCEWCQGRGPTDPHHLHHRGSGRIDVMFNLVGLCRTCHTSHHAGNPPSRPDLLELVAHREQTTVAAILDAVSYLRALGKDGQPYRGFKLSRAARKLVDAALSKPPRASRCPSRRLRPVTQNRGMK